MIETLAALLAFGYLVWQLRRGVPDDPSMVRRTLVAYFASFVLMRGGHVLMGLGASVLVSAGAALAVIMTALNWVAFVRLALLGADRRQRRLLAGFGSIGATIALAGGPGAVAGLVAAPGLVRFRWRHHVSRAGLSLAALAAALAFALSMVKMTLSIAPESPLMAAVHIERLLGGVSSIYMIALVMRFALQMPLGIRPVRWRLLVSYLLAGIVPLVLLITLAGLNTYFSLRNERSTVAARYLQQRAQRLDDVLVRAEASAAMDEPPAAPDRPGVVVLTRGEEGWVALAGDVPSGADTLHALHADDADLPGIIMLGDEAFLAAGRWEAGDQTGPRLIALEAIDDDMLGGLRQIVQAEVVVLTEYQAESTEKGVRLSQRGDGTSGSATERSFMDIMTGALVKVRERVGEPPEWMESGIIVNARVGFTESLRGVAGNLQGNPLGVIPLVVLGAAGFLFLLLEAVTVGMILSVWRSIAGAITALRQGTEALGGGDLEHRIDKQGDDELWSLADAFNDMAAGLERARELEVAAQRLEAELAAAREIQRRLLPAAPPIVAGLELAGSSEPAREVGGDYYDFVARDGAVAVVIADVSGKGVPAALLMSAFRAMLLAQDVTGAGPAASFGRVNDFIQRSVEPGKFVTAFCAVLEPQQKRFRYSSAGHNPPYLVHADGTVDTLSEGGMVIGVMEGVPYPEVEIELQAGDLLLLFTDGVTEAEREDGEQFGEERLLEALRQLSGRSAAEVVTGMLAAVEAFVGDAPQADDLTLLAAVVPAAEGTETSPDG